jgi:tRNA G18 (ribose-2'-O)-methylase SpoU
VARLVAIDDPADERIAAYRDVRERDLVGREGLFIAEGEVVLNVLVRRARHQVVSLLLAEKRVAALRPLIDLLPDDVPVHVAGQEVMDAIVGFPLHRGMLALGRREAEPSPGALLEAAGVRARLVVLFGIANHDNIGGIFRNAAAFGADAVLLDADCCDPLYRKAIRVSVGAALVVPFARLKRGEDVPALLDRYGFTALALTPSGAADLRDVAPPAKAAVLLGAEGPGLPADILARTRPVRIPMASGFDSLNVATASGIVLHYLAGG